MRRSHTEPGGFRLPPLNQAVHVDDPLSASSRKEDSGHEEFGFILAGHSVSDLMDNKNSSDCKSEIRDLQNVLSAHRVYLEQLYVVVGKSRADFKEFVIKTSGIDDDRTSNEIFSIATDRFAAEEDAYGHGSDCTMSREQFATALVRLANLFALINHGMTTSGKISKQTDDFILHSKDC